MHAMYYPISMGQNIQLAVPLSAKAQNAQMS